MDTIHIIISVAAIALCVYGIGRGIAQLINDKKIGKAVPPLVSLAIIGIWIAAILTGSVGVLQIIVAVVLALLCGLLLPTVKRRQVCAVEPSNSSVIISMSICAVIIIAILI